MSVPIIFTHTGNAVYLQLALMQAKKICGDSIYLLGDDSNRCNFVNHFFIDDFSSSDIFNSFCNNFKNLSPNSYDYELFCFKRWFVILDFLKKNNLSECFCVDSDVLIYKDLNCLKNFLLEKDFSVIRLLGVFAGPQCTYFKTEALERYCNFIVQMYSSRFSELETLYERLKSEKNISGISDMVLLALFCNENPGKFIDFDYDSSRDFCFDENISCSAGFEYEDGLKKVVFEENIPHCVREDTKKTVKFYMLHFQGAAKKYMDSYTVLTKKEKELSESYKKLKSTERRKALNEKCRKCISSFIPKPLKRAIKKILRKQ